jgi:hypothetical protein
MMTAKLIAQVSIPAAKPKLSNAEFRLERIAQPKAPRMTRQMTIGQLKTGSRGLAIKCPG